MSQKKTFHFKTLVFLIILLNTSISFSAQKCEKLFNLSLSKNIKTSLSLLNPIQLFRSKEILLLDSRQRQDLYEVLTSSEFDRPHGLGRGTEDPLFIFIWRSLSTEKQSTIALLIDSLPTDIKKFRSNLQDILKKNNISEHPSTNYFELLVSNWFDAIRFSTQPIVFSDWIRQIEKKYLSQIANGSVREENLKFRLEAGHKAKLAIDHWKYSEGIKELTVVSENHEQFIMVNKIQLKIKIDHTKKIAFITVPRSLVNHAAWNPIYSEVLQNKIANATKPPNVYPGFIGANGIFYLSDGNHRFILDTKAEITIEMSYPVKTSSLSITFDAMGIRQPSLEDLVSFYDKQVSLENLIGETLSSKIIYR